MIGVIITMVGVVSAIVEAILIAHAINNWTDLY